MRVFALGMFFALLLAARPVAAFQFSPAASDIAVMPGTDGTAAFDVVNDSGVAAQYVASIYSVDFAEDGAPVFGPISTANAAWFALDSYDFTLAPGAARKVILRASVPQDAESTSFAIAVVVRELAQSTGVTVSTGFSGLTFVTIGVPYAEAVFMGLSTESIFESELPIDFIVTFRNDGVQTLQPTGLLTIRNTFGFESETRTFNPTGGRVVAGQERTFVTTWTDGRENATGLVALWRKIIDMKIGVFTAELNVIPYAGADVVHDVTRVIVLPWSSIIILIGVGILVVLAVRRRSLRR